MRFRIGYSLFCLLIASCLKVVAQDSDYYTENYRRYEDFIYVENVKSVVFEQEGLRLSEPILQLGSDERLLLKFDDLDADNKYYAYTLIHCNADWSPSNLLQSDYLQGFTEDRITDYKSSFNTIQTFTHYQLLIPGREVRPILSGNYLVKVFPEGEPDKPVITRRMMVVEPRTVIDAHVHQATTVQDRDSKQEVDFSISYQGLQVSNPFDDIKVVLKQNGRWDNAVTGLKPLFLKDNLLDYSYDGENSFNGGNEFRTFDTRTMRILTQNVKEILKGNDGFTIVLMPAESRSFKRYAVENDINGRFLIRNQDGRDDDLEGEYLRVKFTLKHDILTDGNYYVFGSLSDWRCGPANKMSYNYDEGTYEALLYLKQGYYDYVFAFLKDGAQFCDETIAEGSHYETVNEYTILVYHRATGSRADKLVGVKKVISR
ncbi:MAG: type IX secretion system plug protein [Arcticibacter sp.]